MQTLTVKPIKHTDVRGKELFYLQISNDVQDHIINVGAGTYEVVRKMQEMKPQMSMELKEGKEYDKQGMSIPEVVKTKDGTKG